MLQQNMFEVTFTRFHA